MCSICHQNPCPSACPNAPDPAVFAECENCGEDILEGDDYYEIDEHKFCEECVRHTTAEVD